MVRSVLIVSSLLATLSSASIFPKSAQIGPSIVRAAVSAHNDDAITSGWGKWRKRQDSVSITNQRAGTSYTIDIEIGTPPQSITVIVDTGSANLWVNPECDTSGQESYCNGFPQFDYTQSSTIEDTGVQDDLTYGKGEVVIEYVTDVVSIGSASITNQIFGLGIESTEMPLGILGLSPPVDGNEEYSYVLDTMVVQGLIASRAFSLDLRDTDSPDGALIFGGIDTGKYSGSLEKCPIIDAASSPGGSDRYWITMTYLGMTDSNGESGMLMAGELPVFLDSGGTMTRLPTEVFGTIGDAFASLGAQYDQESGSFLVDCSVMQESGSIDFGFNNKVISIPFKDFIWQYPDSDNCMLGVLEDNDEPVLGDSFLRAAYVVYDQDNGNLHLAQAANCGTNLVAISAGSDAVPSVTGDCTADTTASIATASLTYATAAPTVTSKVGSLSSLGGPGPQGTAAPTSSGTFCLTCTHTKATSTATAGAKHTKGAAAAREQSPFAAVVGVAALAAWLV